MARLITTINVIQTRPYEWLQDHLRRTRNLAQSKIQALLNILVHDLDALLARQAFSMAKVRLWYSPGACSLASHILLYEAGVPFQADRLDVRAGYPEEFRRLNPKMRVPILSLGDQTITETPAIMTAISQLAPDKQLMGRTNMDVVRVYEWLNWLSGTLHGQGFGGLFRAHRFSDDQNTHASIKAKSTKTVTECFVRIEDDLMSNHAVGNDFTAVDAFLYVFYRWGASIGMKMAETYPNYTSLVSDLARRRAFREALKAEAVKAYLPNL